MTKPNCGLHLTLLMLLSLLLFPSDLRSEFYRYVTEDGDVHYAGDLNGVPEKYRDQIKIYKEKEDYYTPEERLLMIQEEKEAAERARMEEQARQAAEHQKEERIHESKVIIKGNQIFVPVTIGNGIFDYETLLLLDTGASHIVIYSDFANQINILPLGKNIAKLAGGKMVHISNATLDYIQVGPYRMKNAGVLLMDYTGPPSDYSGLLGMNFLRNLHYSIDYKNQKIIWQD